MQIDKGRAIGANWRQSPNYTRGSRSRECIVLHYTASYTAASAIGSFQSAAAKASAHFVVDVTGDTTQMVNLNDTAWHAGFGTFRRAGQVNARSIGIEIVNPGYHFRSADGQWLNWQRKPVSAERLHPFPGMLAARDPWVGSQMAHWPQYPEAQLLAVERIIKACIAAYPSIDAVVGHRDVDGVRKLKVDPGPAFPMARMQKLLEIRPDNMPNVGAMLKISTPGSSLNIRSGPGTGFAKLDRGPLPHGQLVRELGRENGWVHVGVGEGPARFEGWCHGAYLQPA